MSDAVRPGEALGVVGGGQLARMFAVAARRLGYRVHLLAPDEDTPAAGLADEHIQAEVHDRDALARLARGVAVVTYEMENIPVDALAVAGEWAPIRPRIAVLEAAQHRVREKSALAACGLETTPFRAVHCAGDVRAALRALGAPLILKTATLGYDGKGQARIDRESQAEDAWARLGGAEGVCEAYVDFAAELSVVAARNPSGQEVCYGPFVNRHRDHILDVTVFPPPLKPQVTEAALRIARQVMERLDVVGVLCVEFFLTRDERLLINEIAPRPHNSGHLTLDAHLTDQFEQQVRAVCGLPLGSAEPRCAAAMANLLGDLWSRGEPRWEAALREPGVRLHLYGKRDPRPGRKMGHLTALAATAGEAERTVLGTRAALAPG